MIQTVRSKVDALRKKSIKGFVFRKVRAGILHDVIPRSRAKIMQDGNRIVEVVGLFHSASGLGESARLCAKQLKAGGFDVRCISAEQFFTHRKNEPHEVAWNCETPVAGNPAAGCRIIHLNPPMMPQVILGLGLASHFKTYTIGYWAWELDDINREWQRATTCLNAIFCSSEFTSRAVRKHTTQPVITVPHPVSVADAVPVTMRTKLGIADDIFLACSIFNFGSVMERKNPHGTINAFLSAFEDDDKALLLIKTNSGGDGADKKKLLERIQPHKNIRLIDEVWSRDELLGLMKDSNAYISLHRSEGFGLPIAEAMLLGTPVVVTNWSGNVDFCNVDNSCLIDADMVPVSSEYPEFKQLLHLKWADAHVEKAAAALRKLANDKDYAKKIGAKAKYDSAELFSKPVYIDALERLSN